MMTRRMTESQPGCTVNKPWHGSVVINFRAERTIDHDIGLS